MRRRASVAATVGTTIAVYDFFLYNGAVPLVLAPAVAQSGNASSQWLIAGTSFIGFAGRPLGGALFSHYGDRMGRKSTLIVTLLAMGLSTALIGAVPLHLGVPTVALLTFLRLVQGVGLGGEWAGSVLLAMEWQADRGRRAHAASLPQLGVPLGLVLANGLLYGFRLLLPADQFLLVGWRLPFFCSLPLVAFGLYNRLGVHETPVFTALLPDRVEPQPVRRALEHHRRQIAIAALLRMSADVGFYVFIGFAGVYLVQQYARGRPAVAGSLTTLALIATVVGSIAAIPAIPLSGWLADRLGRRRVYGAGIVGLALYAWPFFLLLDTRDPATVILAMVLALVLHSVQFGPQAAMIAEGFTPAVRYSGASLGYQLAPVVAGAWAPLIAGTLLETFHSSVPIALYMAGYCAVSAVALRLLPRPPRGPDVEPASRYRFEVALSYASEDREYVDRVADALRGAGVPLFYDQYVQAHLWGRDLARHLREIYGRESRFVVLFISRSYAAKAWTTRELRFAQAQAIRRRGEDCLLPARIDDTRVPGLSPMIAYVDCRRTTPERLAALVLEKVRWPPSSHSGS
jgi:MFS family permease